MLGRSAERTKAAAAEVRSKISVDPNLVQVRSPARNGELLLSTTISFKTCAPFTHSLHNLYVTLSCQVMIVDLSSLKSIRNFAEEFKKSKYI